ncbi:alpha/beta fold hydrolase [Streptomyces syringium]|uniref:alpha/beta fold hydrolase n=1 Tax=Streptomyces syringium TaxID=76729 RepID=UPI0033F75304
MRPDHRRPPAGPLQDVPITRRAPGWSLMVLLEHPMLAVRRLPLLVAWGLRDPVLRSALADEWQRRFPHAVILRCPRAGHYVLEDERAELVPRIRHFLDTSGERA